MLRLLNARGLSLLESYLATESFLSFLRWAMNPLIADRVRAAN